MPQIKRALKNNGSKEPEFETNDTRDYFITTIRMHEGFEEDIRSNIATHQDKILKFCQKPKTTKEIMLYLGFKDRRNFSFLVLLLFLLLLFYITFLLQFLNKNIFLLKSIFKEN